MSEMSITVTFPTRTYVREADGYYARRDDGGLIDCHTDSDVVWALDKAAALQQDLAAACAEVERLTARLEIDLGGSDKIDELTYALEYVRTEVGQARRTSTYWKDELAAANRECEALSVRASKAEADLAAVRKVEEWHGGLTGRHIVQCADGRFVAAHYPAQQTAGAERIAAGPLDFVSLGRALAAQETDNAK